MSFPRSLICVIDNGNYLDDYDSWDNIIQEQWHSVLFHVVVITTNFNRTQNSPLWDYLRNHSQIEAVKVHEVNHQAANPFLQDMFMTSHGENYTTLHRVEQPFDFSYHVQLMTDVYVDVNPWEKLAGDIINDKFCLMKELDQLNLNPLRFLISNDAIAFSIIQNVLYFAKSQLIHVMDEWPEVCANEHAINIRAMRILTTNHIQKHLITMDFIK